MGPSLRCGILIKAAKGKLEQASQKFGERIYQEAASQQQAQQAQADPSQASNEQPQENSGDAGSETEGEKVYDADYEVVDDEEKK